MWPLSNTIIVVTVIDRLTHNWARNGFRKCACDEVDPAGRRGVSKHERTVRPYYRRWHQLSAPEWGEKTGAQAEKKPEQTTQSSGLWSETTPAGMRRRWINWVRNIAPAGTLVWGQFVFKRLHIKSFRIEPSFYTSDFSRVMYAWQTVEDASP